jgi:tetratricopeptide (TPR) repeat protein
MPYIESPSIHDPMTLRLRTFAMPLAYVAALSCALATSPANASAQVPPGADPTMPSVEIDLAFERYQLDNGLTVILHVDRSDPIAAVVMTFHVGSAREVEGRTGFAHLFELDSTFAYAWTALGGVLAIRGDNQSRAIEAYRTSFGLRSRASVRERGFIEGNHAFFVEGDIVRYRDVERELARQSLIGFSNNWGFAERLLGNYAEAEEILREVLSRAPRPNAFPYANLTWTLFDQGKLDEAFAVMAQWEEAIPSIGATLVKSNLHLDLFDFAAADPLEPIDRARSLVAQGRLREAAENNVVAAESRLQRGLIGAAVGVELRAAAVDLVFRNDSECALARIGEIRGNGRWESIPGPDRPFLTHAILYAYAGRPDLARQVLAEFDAMGSAFERTLTVGARREVEAWIALADNRPDQAVDIAHRAALPDCLPCGLLPLGHAYQRLGQPELAIAALERYLDTPYTGSGATHFTIKLSRTTFETIALLGDTYERLAALHDEQGNVERARHYLSKLIELWQDGDPEVQPRVAAARERLRTLPGA